jgi:hypothetical protein
VQAHANTTPQHHATIHNHTNTRTSNHTQCTHTHTCHAPRRTQARTHTCTHDKYTASRSVRCELSAPTTSVRTILANGYGMAIGKHVSSELNLRVGLGKADELALQELPGTSNQQTQHIAPRARRSSATAPETSQHGDSPKYATRMRAEREQQAWNNGSSGQQANCVVANRAPGTSARAADLAKPNGHLLQLPNASRALEATRPTTTISNAKSPRHATAPHHCVRLAPACHVAPVERTAG